MRIFIAIDITDDIRERIARFVDGVRGFSPEARWVQPESLHVTLKFIGEKSPEDVEKIKQALPTVKTGAPEIRFRGFGFFPTAKAPRVFWLGIEAGPQLASLAAVVDKTMSTLGIPKEDHEFSPHLTLARGAGGSGSPRWRKGDAPHRGFQQLQEKLAALPRPEFGNMTAHEFFLYQSQLSPKGSRYTKLAGFALE
jgi:2'-5' RNA ligase